MAQGNGSDKPEVVDFLLVYFLSDRVYWRKEKTKCWIGTLSWGVIAEIVEEPYVSKEIIRLAIELVKGRFLFTFSAAISKNSLGLKGFFVEVCLF